jgi:replicative DNA helicase
MVFDVITEQAILVSAAFSQNALSELVNLDREDFHVEKNQIIFDAIVDIYSSGENVDTLSIRQRLVESGNYSKVGGDAFIIDFARTGTIHNVSSAIRTIRAYSQKRKLVRLIDVIREGVSDKTKGNIELLSEIEETLKSIHDLKDIDYRTFFDLIKDGLQGFEIDGTFLPTGFYDLDNIIIGLFNSELTLLGARPGVGKSALALNIATHVAREKTVLFFSLEMSKAQLGLRMVSSYTRTDSDKIRRGVISQETKDFIFSKYPEMKRLNLFPVDNAFTIDEITTRIRRFAQGRDLDLVIIDYLQLVRGSNRNIQRYVQIGEISRSLKLLAMELEIPILALCQLNRAADEQAPKLSDLRESGDLEQDADMVIFIHKKDEEDNYWLHVKKNRSGMTGKTRIIFNKPFSKFENIERNHADPRSYEYMQD